MRTSAWMVLLIAMATPAIQVLAQGDMSSEALALRKELAGLQLDAMNSAEGSAKRAALGAAIKQYREAVAKIPEFQALEAEQSALRDKMKLLAQRRADLETKYAAQLGSLKQARDAAAQEVQAVLSGGSRGEAIKARLAVLMPSAPSSR